MNKVNIAFVSLFGLILAGAHTAQAQAESLRADLDSATAIRCELQSARSPDAIQVHYFYLNDARRTVLETDGNALGNVVQFSRQRIVVTKNAAEGGLRYFTFDRMIGALSISNPAGSGSRDGLTLSGGCQKVDASRQKF